MLCKVSLCRPDGTRARHVGHYPNPGVAMDVVQALYPNAHVNAAVAAIDTAGKAYTCEELGVCQNTSRACPPHTICAMAHKPHYFAPGVIEGAASTNALLEQPVGWTLETTWTDWVGAALVLFIIGLICGAMQ
jgi:hypothetical protein